MSSSQKPAAGFGAIASTLGHLKHEKALRPGLGALRQINQKDGFDCPGCAWPESADRSHFEFCENGAKAVAAETTTKRVTPEFFERHSVQALLEMPDYWLEQQGRLTHPMIRYAGSEHYEPISWSDAFARAGQFLRGLDSPDQAAFYTSGRTSNEAAFLYQLFGRMYGTNNFPDCSNLCHESSGVGLTRTIGLGKGAVQLADFEKADAIFIIGQNPGTNHPRMLSTLLAARRRGVEIVSINPLRERGLESFTDPKEPLATLFGRGTALSTLYLQPMVGSDVAVLNGIMKLVLEAESEDPGRVLDHDFIRRHTAGFEALAEDLTAASWKDILDQSGLTRAELKRAADIYIGSRATIICWAMGLTQHANAVDNVIACSNLLLLKGNIGRPGAGPCPVRGHSNVQGDRTVGITHQPSASFNSALREVFNFEPPTQPGLDVVETIRAMHEGKIRFFMSMGGNFHSASPDTDYTAAALRETDLCIHVATKLNRSHLVTGDEAMIWPCLGRTEVDRQAAGPQSVTVEDSMSCVHASEGRKPPASPDLKSEPAIVAGLASATLSPGSGLDWNALIADYDRIRDMIEQVLPIFDGYNENIRQPDGFVLRHPAAHREWLTESGKAEFEVVSLPSIHLAPGQLRMFTIRSHDQFNTTIYGMDDRYRGISGDRRVAMLNAADIAENGLSEGDRVDIVGAAEDGRTRVAPDFRVVSYNVPKGCVATYFPETNVLVPIGSTARGSNTPSSKMVPVTLRRSGVEASSTAGLAASI